MNARFVPIPDVATLDDWLPRPGPVLLFLHDPGCGTSLAAHRHVSRVEGDVALVDVRLARAVSRAIEQRTGVRHESPQVILLADGRPVWSASHRAITTEAVTAAYAASGLGASR